MSAPTIVVLGKRMRPLERIEPAGQVVGWGRSTAYRMADAGELPLTGPTSSRWVRMIPWLESLGIPYTIEGGDDDVAQDPRNRA